MIKTTFQFIFLSFLAVGLMGCAGYQLGPAKPSAFASIDRIFIPSFKNETLEPRLSSLVTNAIIKEVQADGTYKVSRKQEADAVLSGTILSIRKRQLRGVRTDTLQSRELGVYIYVRWRLDDPNTGKQIVTFETPSDFDVDELQFSGETIQTRPGIVIGETIHFVDASFQVGERNAFAPAAEDAAKKLVSQLSNGW